MRILGHIHTFNDEDVIDQSLSSLLDQSYGVSGIVIVDNGSTDRTLERSFPDSVHIIRHGDNRGTSGAVVSGFKYALEQGYDWIWVLDADSRPRPDALEMLVTTYQGFSPETRQQVCAMAVGTDKHEECSNILFTPSGYEHVALNSDQTVYECHGTVWSGTLFKLEAVKRIGLPSEDYVLDWGEYAYGYQARKHGYRLFMCRDSLMDHNIGDVSGVRQEVHRLGPLRFTLPDVPPIRIYYIFRNTTYFWLFEYFQGDLWRFLRGAKWVPIYLAKLLLAGKLRPDVVVALRGLKDGFSKNMQRRF